MLLHLGDQLTAVGRDAQRAVDRGQPVWKDGIEDDAFDLDDRADVRALLAVAIRFERRRQCACARYPNHSHDPDV